MIHKKSMDGGKNMVIIEAPYVSEHFLGYLQENRVPVLENAFARSLSDSCKLNWVKDEEAIEQYKEDKKLYLSSENALDWIYKNLPHEKIIDQLGWIRDKAQFRKLLSEFYPTFFFAEIDDDKLEAYDPSELKFPVVLKPAVGFFSIGVYVINNEAEWAEAIKSIRREREREKDLFPQSVVGLQKYIVEAYIEGIEYAIDAYYDEQGEPVILNIFTHRFASQDDVSDRIYYTSKEIIEQYEEPFKLFLKKMNSKLGLAHFPMHLELRVSGENIIPIEVNPMRFAGLSCTDIAYYAYGINTVDYYLNNKVPNFKEILKGKEDKIYSLIVLDKKSVDLKCCNFDYEKLVGDFEHVICLRKVDVGALDIFGFVFTETSKGNEEELDRILHSDLMEYMKK